MKSFKILIVSGLLMSAPVFYGCGEKEHHGEAGHMRGQKSAMRQHREKLSGRKVNGVREIKLEVFQFGFKPETIIVKKGEEVRIIAKSIDVMHGIGIKELNINQKLPPNQEKVIEFMADRSGRFHFHCSVYCGAGHGKMHGMLIVNE